ncbi:MAG: acetyltransferase [bacterium]
MQDIAIWGAGGFGREVAWLIEEINRADRVFTIIGFLDDRVSLVGQEINGYPVVGGLEYLGKNQGIAVVMAVGNPVTRFKMHARIQGLRLSFPNLIHPSVIKGRTIQMGVGNVICAGAILTENITIGDFCQFNLKTTIGHDVRLGDFTTSACSVDFAGYSSTGFGVYIGNQATLLPSVSVGDLSVIGAGAVVNKDIPDGMVAVGVPARAIKRNPVYDEMKNDIESSRLHGSLPEHEQHIAQKHIPQQHP